MQIELYLMYCTRTRYTYTNTWWNRNEILVSEILFYMPWCGSFIPADIFSQWYENIGQGKISNLPFMSEKWKIRMYLQIYSFISCFTQVHVPLMFVHNMLIFALRNVQCPGSFAQRNWELLQNRLAFDTYLDTYSSAVFRKQILNSVTLLHSIWD